MYGPYDMNHIIWAISYGPYQIAHKVYHISYVTYHVFPGIVNIVHNISYVLSGFLKFISDGLGQVQYAKGIIGSIKSYSTSNNGSYDMAHII